MLTAVSAKSRPPRGHSSHQPSAAHHKRGFRCASAEADSSGFSAESSVDSSGDARLCRTANPFGLPSSAAASTGSTSPSATLWAKALEKSVRPSTDDAMRKISLGSFGAPPTSLRRRASIKMRARSRPSSLHAGNPNSSWSSAASQRRSKFVSVTAFHSVSEALDLEPALRTRARMLHNARLFVSLLRRVVLRSKVCAESSSAHLPRTIRPLRTLRSTNSAKNSVSGAQHSNGSQRSARPWPASTVISVIGSQAAASAPKKTVRLRAWRSTSISTGLSPAGCGS